VTETDCCRTSIEDARKIPTIIKNGDTDKTPLKASRQNMKMLSNI
jgi:hypothetical protein